MGTLAVVGGGISGILTALLLRERFPDVCLIEKADKLGGMLSSVQSPAGDSYDHGTHYLVNTGHEKIDALLFPEEWKRGWLPLPYLKAGNYFRGRLNEQCMFADTRLLAPEVYRRGVDELLASATLPEGARNLREYLEGTFGRTFTGAVFEPLVKARLGMELEALHPNGHMLIGLNRILALDPETTRKLKQQSPAYDVKLGYHSYLEGTRPTMSHYPREGGTGVWIDLLERRLEEAGVRVLKNTSIRSLRHESGTVSAIEFETGGVMACDAIFWTLPVSGFLKCCGLPTMIDAPSIRVTSHFHYSFDRPPATDLYYFLCNDPAKLGFRATLYSNVQPELATRTGRYGVSVEVLSGPIPDVEEASRRIVAELVEMGIFGADAKVLWKTSRSGIAGIPVITPKFVRQTQQQMEALRDGMRNAHFSGMVPGVSFFKKEVLTQSYEQVENFS